ncbi:hypothetical protein BpHYR1_024988 [Brachionus plicatilis]|uniref:Uncharacterized protein n=1 Tax=Brachionus plicatilis TaxID=10195 RepID=A0A3M7RV60_BRAPC|nr:hypothetical protein BpHYR1_024988 [Brachionus plicatilis]
MVVLQKKSSPLSLPIESTKTNALRKNLIFSFRPSIVKSLPNKFLKLFRKDLNYYILSPCFATILEVRFKRCKTSIPSKSNKIDLFLFENATLMDLTREEVEVSLFSASIRNLTQSD